MHKRDGLSATHEMYLKIIYQLQQSGDPARIGQMAKGLGVQPSTVSAVVRTLASMDLVTHDRYGVVKLTPVGERLAECVSRRFDVLQRFYTQVLGLDEESAAIEACETEHVVTAATVARIEHLIGQLEHMGYAPPCSFVPKEAEMCFDCVVAGECTAAQSLSRDK